MNNDKEKNMDFVSDDAEQVKLKEISVYNWGSLNGLHTVQIDPKGTLITGENGSGKSTLVDALMTLLRPAGGVTYNVAAAQDQKKDRTIVSYMRGAYGNAMTDDGQVARNLRDKSVVSVIKACYEYTLSGRMVVLLGVFYISGDSNAISDVKRIYSVLKTNVEISEVLSHFGTFDTKSLKAYLKSFDNSRVCESFTEYETYFRQQLKIDNVNATALLTRALGLKRIDDLTDLIRTLVLEKGELAEDARKTIDGFEDLKEIHSRLTDLKKQEDALSSLPVSVEKYEKAIKNSESSEKALNELISYAARFEVKDLQKTVGEYEVEKSSIQQLIKDTEQSKDNAENYREICHVNFIQNGGERIELLSLQLNNQKALLAPRQRILSDYNSAVQNIGLTKVKCRDDFNLNLEKLPKLIDDNNNYLEALSQNYGEKKYAQQLCKSRLSTALSEYEELRKRKDSNMPLNYQNFRDTLVSDLKIKADTLVFVSELIEVKSEFSQWQGAIERALGGNRQILLVSENDYRNINAYVNGRFFKGLHIRILVAKENIVNKDPFDNHGYLSRLNFKNHPYTGFLKSFLKKYELCCVDSVEELNRTEFSLTKEGMIHRKKGSFEKKDLKAIDDKKEWFLGFSNQQRLNLLNDDIQNVKLELNELQKVIDDIDKQRTEKNETNQILQSIKRIQNFSDLDVFSLEEEIKKLTVDIEQLSKSSTLAQLKEKLEEAVKNVKDIETELSKLHKEIGSKDALLKSFKTKLQQKLKDAQGNVTEESKALIDKAVLKSKLSSDNFYNEQNLIKVRNELSSWLKNFNSEKNSASNSIIGIISYFNRGWESVCVEYGKSLDSYPQYLDYLTKLRKDNLPAQADRFKERLTSTGTQSIAAINSRGKAEINLIKDRINSINEVLKKVDFKENSYLRIDTKMVKSVSLDDFEKQSARVMNLVGSEDHELRYKAISVVIQSLEEALKSTSNDKRAVLDTRLRVQFAASVIDSGTGEVNDTLTSSSGKSGGEKEAFAGSVLAAALAYVLTPVNGNHPVYSTVFLDEAFSNTSEENSRRVLKIFNELNLHVNLITPFKNLDLARDYASSLIIMSRDEKYHSTSMCHLTWEEHDRLVWEKKKKDLEDLGISINEEDDDAES